MSPGELQFEVAGVDFSYGRTPVLTGIDLTVHRGELLGILGPNGSGKTTLLRLLMGRLRPDRGEVRLDGRSMTDLGAVEVARQVALVPQETAIGFPFRVHEIVMMGRYCRLGRFELEGSDDLDRARRAMLVTDTEQLAERPYPELSGGEKQRVLLASALAQETGAVLLDEPTSSLDIRYQVETFRLLERINRETGKTILVTLHDLNLASQLCSRVALLTDGRLEVQGAPKEVLTVERIEATYGARVRRFDDLPGGSVLVPRYREND